MLYLAFYAVNYPTPCESILLEIFFIFEYISLFFYGSCHCLQFLKYKISSSTRIVQATNFSDIKFIICNKKGALLLSSSHLQIVGVLRHRTDTQLFTFFCCVHHRTIDEEALEQALSAAVTCTILAAAGPQRSRVLATLYKVNNLSVLS